MICPTCERNPLLARDQNKHHPFCSERCQLADLGRWLNEDYKVPDLFADGFGPSSGEQS